MTNAPVSLTIQLTQDEVYRASVRVMLRKLRIFIFLGVIFLLIVGGAFVAHPSTWQELLKSILPFFYLMFAFCVAVFVVPYFSTRASFKKDDQEPTILTFADDGITIQSSDGKSHADWEAIQHVTETQRDFLVGISKTVFWTIPKRTIPDEFKLIALRKLFEENVQGRTTLLHENT
jgi:hypothetical protein